MCNVSLNGTQPSDASLRVLRALEAAGLEAWYVGGWVRDALMGCPSHDVDMCCNGLWQESKAALEAAGIVQSMSRKANCIDNAATEQLFGHVKDVFYRGREWKTFEDFKRDLEEYIVHWNTSRRQVRLKGLTPEEYRNQALAA